MKNFFLSGTPKRSKILILKTFILDFQGLFEALFCFQPFPTNHYANWTHGQNIKSRDTPPLTKISLVPIMVAMKEFGSDCFALLLDRVENRTNPINPLSKPCKNWWWSFLMN